MRPHAPNPFNMERPWDRTTPPWFAFPNGRTDAYVATEKFGKRGETKAPT